jgi:hypothetical protein
MSNPIYDIEDLTQVLSVNRPARTESSFDREDLSIPIIIEEPLDDELDDTFHLVDTMVDEEQQVYRFEQGRYLRYRIGVLGIGLAVEQFYFELKEVIKEAVDPLVEEMNLWAKYQVALFGGKPKDGGVAPADANLLADRLALFKPNYLVLVNAGQVKNKFADKTPQQLAMLSLHINSGAMERRQRPYTLVLVTDKLIGPQTFSVYRRICLTMNTYPAEKQFSPEEIDAVVNHVRFTLKVYTEQHLKVADQR